MGVFERDRDCHPIHALPSEAAVLIPATTYETFAVPRGGPVVQYNTCNVFLVFVAGGCVCVFSSPWR